MARRFRLNQRACGVLLHPTSLPGPHGCGDLGPQALRFVDFLAAAGQRWWQMLPVGPLCPDNSPYSSYSAFAGGPHLISLERLVEDGLLEERDLRAAPGFSRVRVLYGPVLRFKEDRLRRAFANFQHSRGSAGRTFARFRETQRDWLDDFALFCAVRRAQRNRHWYDWPLELRLHRRAALRRAARELRAEIEYNTFVQFIFDRQWAELKHHAARNGVGLLGDVPMFVAHDSSDVWADQDLFRLDKRGRPTVVSGVPPDEFSRTGQLWGHPLYRWSAHRSSGWKWWIGRFRRCLEQVDAVRIDHFLGFARCWAVPARARTARDGRWTPTPGDALLSAVHEAVGTSALIAEDLGAASRRATALRERFGIPGMRILQCGFGDEGGRYHEPHNFPKRCVVYTGTHDNQTTRGWYAALSRAARRRLLDYVDTRERRIHWDLIRLAYQSPADLAIIPMQDVLGLDDAARMNRPATVRGNWEWRMSARGISSALAGRMRKLAETYERA